MLRWLTVCLLALVPLNALAEERVALGWGRLFDNDAIGDMHDRWRTGSYTISQVRGYDWRGTLPTRPFDLLEFRAQAATVAPADLTTPDPADRRYAGMFSFGIHSQFDFHGFETNIGGDLVVTGPQTGISKFQGWVHDILGMPEPGAYANQIGNGVFPTVSAEIGKTLSFGPGLSFRPFAAASVGIETFARVGGDLTLGHFGEGSVMLRDDTTGQRYRAVAGDQVTGFSLVAGGDVARVFDSALLPSGGAAVLSDTRERLRLGMQWQGKSNAVFYGVTWLGPEFDGQPQGQVVGSLNIQLQF
jgi:hypothetical protein